MAIYSGYVGAKSCTRGPSTGARGVLAWLLAKYADDGALNGGIYNCRDIRGGTTTSLHGEGRAVDLAIRPYSAGYGTELADLIRRHSAELGIQCVIWNRKIWSGYYDDWRNYTGLNPHVDHLHIELSWAAANRSADDTIALWERVLGDMVDDDGIDVAPVGKPEPSAPRPKKQPTDYSDLSVDGKLGPKTIKALQIVMRAIGTYSRAVDGDFGRHTVIAVQRWLRGLGFYKRAVDGHFGKHTARALQQFLRSRGLYPASRWLIDGDLGPATVRALQTYLNTQNGK